MLGLHGGSVVSADTLAELLWGARPPRTAVKALQTHISSLRRGLGDGFVLTEGSGWTLNTTEIDATRYKMAARLGRDAVAAGDAAQAVTRFDEALSLWRGVPELPDGPRAASEKTRWIEGHAALVEDRADALLATGRAAEIVGELEAAIAEAPLRERRWGQLMLALYRAGRQGEALAAYQRARSLLVDELGVDPGPNLRRLEAAIVAQDPALEIPVSQHLSTVTKAVTFLLTDIEGSTAAWEAQADAMAVALARHDEIVEQVVTSRGGRLVKTRGEGDATFSVFDRPSSAATAAIELQEAIRHEPWALASPMRIRISLHTGEVELRDGDYFGRAVNRAARLRSLAAGGQILCSGATAELVIDTLADDVVLADLGMRQLKNLARPEHVFELRLEAVEDTDTAEPESPMRRPSLPAVLTGPGPFVGRGEELAGLLTAWQSTLTVGTRAVLVAGEPGVGKTRLAGEWSRQVYEEGAIVLYGRCDEDLGAAYQPFAEALRSLVPCLGADRLRGLRGVEALLPLVPGLADVVPDLPTSPRSDPDTERYALFDAVVALLGAASTRAPVVLILDDLHWAAKPTLLLLRHLLRFGEQARVQIVGTYRSTDLDRSHPLAAMLTDLHRDGSASRLALTGLDEKDVSAYVSEAGYDDEELARALASVTGGNPFFLIEALRHVDESGGRWDPNTLPQGVREAVSRRLSRLPEETNKALAAAAVVGSRFAVELVERVVDGDLVDAFDEARKAGIVIEEPGGRYRFNHALVRQSLLAELPSVRRMRLHQRIAVTLEAESGAEDELLAELAYHYFECAWAGNAAKAVEYCRRAADQAMSRLAYEGAADLYDRALHALEELDDELPDRDALQAELLVARCEALLAAGDVGSAAGAVAQLQQAAGDSVRLAAWGTCFDGELSMLTNPEQLDEIEVAVGAAAAKLAGLEDAAGEAKAHTVRAGCLTRLGRIGDAETALDQALTAARRAHDHRRVNAVLAGAPLAALWGPNPVPRAGGRCLDVVRLLRITTGSPVVEATSTRCQGVLDALRGRAAAGRALIDSARRSLTELGMRHALLEVEQFAGIVELIANEPAAAEPLLRRACDGFRRMGLDADTAETAAFLAKACLALDRDADADELCTESERLAGHALKPSITWRTVRAQLLARAGAHDEARRVAEEAVSIAERTDALVDHGDACLTLAVVLNIAGDVVGARSAADQAVALFERKGAAALAELALSITGSADNRHGAASQEPPLPVPENACLAAVRRWASAFNREAGDDYEAMYAPDFRIESRRRIVGFTQDDLPSGDWSRDARRLYKPSDTHRMVPIAVRGDRLALARLEISTADTSPGAPRDEVLQIFAIDETGRVARHLLFDVEDMDAAVAELDALHAQLELENACVRVIRRIDDAYDRNAWDELEQHVAPVVFVDSRRKVVGLTLGDVPRSEWMFEARTYREVMAPVRYRHNVVAVRGDRFALTSLQVGPEDKSPGAPRDEFLQLYGLDQEGLFALQIWFDSEDMDAAIAELDARYLAEQGASTSRLENNASRMYGRIKQHFANRAWDAVGEMLADDVSSDDRRKVVNAGVQQGRDACLSEFRGTAEVGVRVWQSDVIAIRGEHLVFNRVRVASDQRSNAFNAELLDIIETDADGRVKARIVFDTNDFDAAIAELDARYLAGEAAPYARVWRSAMETLYEANSHEPGRILSRLSYTNHQRVSFGSADFGRAVQELWELVPDARYRATSVHALDAHGVVASLLIEGTDSTGNELQWHRIVVLLADESRMDVYDDDDLTAALAKFNARKSTTHLENAASRADVHFNALFGDGRLDEIGQLFVDDLRVEDRRRGLYRVGVGRAAELAEVRAIAELGTKTMKSHVLAVRGERLALVRTRYSGRDQRPDAFHTEVLRIAEVNDDQRIVAYVAFDLDDLDAAFAELDARYLSGEAAPHAHVWSVVVNTYAAFNREDYANVVSVDHRKSVRYAPGELTTSRMKAHMPDLRSYIEVVHRLNDVGVVVTGMSSGTSDEGFEAEWRMALILTVDGDRLAWNELFDEEDLDDALARFDELNRSRSGLDSTASRVLASYLSHFAARDWDAMWQALADQFSADDRRRVLNGPKRGRDEEIANFKVVAELGCSSITSTPVATRGERLVLAHHSLTAAGPAPLEAEMIDVVEVNRDNKIVNVVFFDTDQLDAAIAVLDAWYAAAEAAEYANTWSVVAGVFDSLNRHETPAATPDWVNVDHRRGTPLAHSDLREIVKSLNEITPDLRNHIEAVHVLSQHGAVLTQVSRGTSPEGFGAEWRMVNLLTVDGDLVSRCELFDESDLDVALARFQELCRPAPGLENAASRAIQRFNASFAQRDWAAMASMLADDSNSDDRRRMVGGADLRGRDAMIDSFKTVAEFGTPLATSTAHATRGERLVLTRVRYSVSDDLPDAFHAELLQIIEVDRDSRIETFVTFDLDAIDAAFAELDSRYLADEGAEYAHTWALVARAFTDYNRREQPGVSPDWVNIDHRRATAFPAGDMIAYMGVTWADTPDVKIHIEEVHRLNARGAVVTWAGHGNSTEGFEAEWRATVLVTVDGDLINRCEMFDTSDLDTALTKFDELSSPTTYVENSATRIYQRFMTTFVARDWKAMAETLAPEIRHVDRRRVVNGGIQHGPDDVIANMRAVAEVGVRNIEPSFFATRGDRLALGRQRVSGDKRPEAFGIEVLIVAEVDADNRLVGGVAFDPDDLEAAIAELDARYIAGEAAAYADTWSVISRGYAAVMRHELPAFTPDAANIDHRHATAFAPGELSTYLHAMWDQTPNEQFYIETVHRLASAGAVVTHIAKGTSQQGFEGEWREVTLSIVEGGTIKRSELFDEADLDLALARFEELNRRAPQLENAASQMITRFQKVFGARDWDGMAKIFAEDICLDDRRRVVGARFVGREATIANMQASADTGVKNVTSTVLATRGDRLSLQRVVISGRDNRPDAFRTEALHITEVDVHDQATAFVMFDPHELDAAFAELDARYLAGEARGHSGTWSAIAEGYAAFNRREMPKTTPDWLNIDHRRGGSAFAPGDQTSYIHATWEVAPQVRSDAAAVHRLNRLGAVVTQTTSGTSHEGFDVEWQDIILFTVEGDLLARCEVFNEDDLDAALAKFDELSRQAPRLQNLASQVGARFRAAYASRHWDAMADMLAEDSYNDDRRSVVNGGIRRGRDSMMDDLRSGADIGIPEFRVTEIATRGERLVLVRAESHYDERPQAFYVENLTIGEIDADQRIAAQVMFDIDDVDAAYQELESRYLAGEAAAHAQTWSVIVDTYAALNRHELASTPPDWVYVDHHRLALWQGDFTANMLAAWEVIPDWRIQIVAVHHLTNLGAVITAVASGSSRDGFNAEEPGIALVTVRDGVINRFEYFDVADLDAALTKFDELNVQSARPENAATRSHLRLNAAFAARDWNAMAELLPDDTSSDDRRPIVGGGLRCGRDAVIDDWRAIADVGVKSITSTVIATRGERLALGRYGFVGHDQRPEAYHTEVLGIVEFDSDQRMTACVMLDLEEIDAAFDELEARYAAGEAAAHAHTWTLVTNAFAAMNRREMPATRPDWVTIDHRRLSMIDPTSRDQYLSAAIDVTQLGVYVEEVHRLSDAGAVVSWQGQWTTPEGFDAEWHGISVLIFDGDLVARCELFDEADLEVALERFDELTSDVPRLENAASNAYKRYNAHFVAREWDAMAEIVADDVLTDDRRRVVSGGIQSGRAAQAADMRAVAGVGVKSIESSVIATRGDRLALIRVRVAGDERPDAFGIELLIVVGINEDDRLVAGILFDLDDIDAAFAELEARYLAGEASAHAEMWSMVANGYAALNRQELPETSNWVVVDHRVRQTFKGDDLAAYVRSLWNVAPGAKNYSEAVHRLSDVGALVTHAAYGTSPEGFRAEWRMIALLTVGDSTSSVELFDESDLETATAKFEEQGRQVREPHNIATRMWTLMADAFHRRDVEAFVDLTHPDGFLDDRRKGLRVSLDGSMRKRAVEVLFEFPQSWRMELEHVAVRGSRLSLSRHFYRDTDQFDFPITVEVVTVTECSGDDRVHTLVLFDPEDIDAAFTELDRRYLAGMPAKCANAWTIIAEAYSGMTRGEFPPTTTDLVNIDHRRAIQMAPDSGIAYLRASWEVAPEFHLYIEAVHRLTELGAVFTRRSSGTSRTGFDAEWRAVDLITLEGGLINRGEIFEEEDLDTALARFDELARPTRQFSSTAGRVTERVRALFAARDWDRISECLAENFSLDDRRRTVNGGLSYGRETTMHDMRTTADTGFTDLTEDFVAFRGERLVLTRARYFGSDPRFEPYFVEVLHILEIDANEKIVATIVFDPDDLDAAVAELDSRYLKGEASAHPGIWSVFARTHVGLNRHEIPTTIADTVHVDHRQLITIEPSDMAKTLHTAWDLMPDLRIYVEAVHRLTSVGGVITSRSYGTSRDGFDAEWRMLHIGVVAGDRISRYELFDESDLQAALARFAQLHDELLGLENAATRASASLADAFNRRDLNDLVARYGAKAQYEDRRKGLQNVGLLSRDFGAGLFELEAASTWRMETTPIGVRGDCLALVRHTYRDTAKADRPVTVEALLLMDADNDGLICHCVLFDPDDIDAAFEELDTRYGTGEAAGHARTWALVARSYATFSRHEMPATTTDWVNIDHRRATAFAPGDLDQYVRAAWSVTPDTKAHIQAVHRLNSRGAVLTVSTYGTSPQGFGAEWQDIHLATFDGDLCDRFELFDEADLDAALARFDELSLTVPQLANAATNNFARIADAFNRRDLTAFLGAVTANARYEDQRMGFRNEGPVDANLVHAMLSKAADGWRVTIEPIAVRGRDLALSRYSYRDVNEVDRPITFEALVLTEVAEEHLSTVFDPADIDAAFEELDVRYLAGEAAEYAQTWSTIIRGFAGFGDHDLPDTAFEWIDHRTLVGSGISDPGETSRAVWDMTSDIRTRIVAVHRLDNRGAVITHVIQGTSREGFDFELRLVDLIAMAGGIVSRCECFDEADLDAAIARFDELSHAAPLLDNAATRARSRVIEAYNSRVTDAFPAATSGRYEDRRKGLRDEGTADEKYVHAVFSGTPTSWRIDTEFVGIRGDRLALSRERFRDSSEAHQPITVELLTLTSVDEGDRIAYTVFFDPEDVDSAFGEIDARWIASGGCAHPEVIKAVQSFAEMANRHDWDALAARHAGATYANHRQLRSGADTVADDMSSLRMLALLVPDLRFEATEVLRLSAGGTVIHTVARGTSTEDVPIEIPLVILMLIDGDRITRAETFDLNQRNDALDRFEELDSNAPPPENAIARVLERVVDAFDRRDPQRYLALFADDCTYEDRRKGLRDQGSIRPDYAQTVTFGADAGWQAEFETIAVRGEHLMLGRATFRDQSEAGSPVTVEALNIGSIDDDELISWFAVLDPDDIDAAFAELTARWIASGEVAHPEVIEAAHRSNEMYNRHDWDAIKANESGATYVNHRQLVSAEPETIEDHWRSIRALATLIPDLRTEPTEILAHSAKGVVADLVVKGRTPTGTVIEFPAITLILFDGTRVAHMEAFDVDQRGLALDRFDELNRPE
ncbi:putative ATPase [Mycolicibacterium rhodesiae NBB3]|uniref:Putative ATPase n=2 Tax=Mycolicibacterium rhodesiae TaxID=36814 RepID=G8RUP6_MYCRN|nr:putative ATPase [Mycolicibacterium rhodesiae NBB3]